MVDVLHSGGLQSSVRCIVVQHCKAAYGMCRPAHWTLSASLKARLSAAKATSRGDQVCVPSHQPVHAMQVAVAYSAAVWHKAAQKLVPQNMTRQLVNHKNCAVLHCAQLEAGATTCSTLGHAKKLTGCEVSKQCHQRARFTLHSMPVKAAQAW